MTNRSLSPDEIAWDAHKILQAALCLPEPELTANSIINIIKQPLLDAFLMDPDLLPDLRDMPTNQLQQACGLVAEEIFDLISD